MIPVLLILIPLLTGLAAFFFRDEKTVRGWALASAIGTLAVSVLGLTVLNTPGQLAFRAEWMQQLGSSFSIGLDGMGQLLCLLTAVAYPLILLATWNSNYKKAHNFFALMLLTQAGLMGVFLAMDGLLFYFFWELALIPVYFLCSQWGGERRIQVTFKFFIYTFIGSLLMLVGILYVYSITPGHSFSIDAFYRVVISNSDQMWLFWLFLAAFAIKMPIFPFHGWQPDTYEQSPTAVTMVLSGIMVKMGVFGVLRWMLPILPQASFMLGDNVVRAAIVGMLYASFVAIRQDDIKRLVAYSSIAHVGLMAATIFAETSIGMQGVMIQMFSHGINIIGMWIIVELIERQYGTRKISGLGGLASQAPGLTIFMVIIALANIALPLTNAFVGEFLMFTGLYNSTASELPRLAAVLAGVCIILGAIYTLNMIRKVFYGETVPATQATYQLKITEKLSLSIIVILILWMGVYPKPVLNLTKDVSATIIKKAETRLPKK